MPHKHTIKGRWTGQWLGQVKVRGKRTRKLFPSKSAAKAWEVEMKRTLGRQGLQSEAPRTTTATVYLLDWTNQYLDYSLRYSLTRIIHQPEKSTREDPFGGS